MSFIHCHPYACCVCRCDDFLQRHTSAVIIRPGQQQRFRLRMLIYGLQHILRAKVAVSVLTASHLNPRRPQATDDAGIHGGQMGISWQ